MNAIEAGEAKRPPVFRPLLERLFVLVQPKSCLVVGVNGKEEIYWWADLCQNSGATLEVASWEENLDSAVLEKIRKLAVVHCDLPLNLLGRCAQPELVWWRPDPNWFTVYHGLKLLRKRFSENGKHFPFLLLCGVGWPWGRRDGYQNIELIPVGFRQPARTGGLDPLLDDLAPSGGFFANQLHAVAAGGPKNGVLTAVEDFLADEGQGLGLALLPGEAGLALLWNEGSKVEKKEAIDFLRELRLSPLLTETFKDLDLHRLAEIDGIEKIRLREQEILSAEKTHLQKELDELTEQLAKIKESTRSEMDELQNRVEESARMLVAIQKRLAELQEREKLLQAERDSLAERLHLLRQEKQAMEVRFQELTVILEEWKAKEEKSRRETAEKVSQIAEFQQRLSEQGEQLTGLEKKLRWEREDKARLVFWLEQIGTDVDRHLHSWTWKVGSLALAPIRLLTRQPQMPTEKLRVFQVLSSFRRWKRRQEQ